MTRFVKGISRTAALWALAWGAPGARAATAPAYPCSLLPAATVIKTAGASFGAPRSSVAPRPFAHTVQGTDCNYVGGSGKYLLFRICFDPSAGDATTRFAKLRMFYSPSTPVSGVGDDAYLDAKGALHALKGIVRYREMGQGHEAPTKALGALVAGEL
ncbi:MAG: hypothetical protein WAN28_11925 [Terracidiphilus sp.]